MTCNCRGGPFCCMRAALPEPAAGPFKCPECGAWWAGGEHRCPPSWWRELGTAQVTVRCTCPPNRGDNYFGTCPVHDVRITYAGVTV